MVDSADKLSFGFWNKLGSFLKLEKNYIILVIFNVFIFRANYTICKIAFNVFLNF